MKNVPPAYFDLYDRVSKTIGPNRTPALIGIDGRGGAGKSSAASWLSWQFGMPARFLDLFIIDLTPLRWRINDIAKCVHMRETKPLIVESIMLLEVLRQIRRKPDLHVFVERADHSTRIRPLDSDELDSPESLNGQVDAYIERERLPEVSDLQIKVDY